MKLFSLLLLWSLLLQPAVLQAYSKTPPKEPSPEQGRHTLFLKKYMSDFGSLVAGMEILRIKEKKPDWEAINVTLRDMEDTIQRLQAADKNNEYKEFTDALYQNLKEVQAYGEKRDKKIYEAFDKLTNTCFKCHAAHRPSDFLVPKEKEPRVSRSSGMLFNP